MPNEKSNSEKRKYPRKRHITGIDYYILSSPQGTGIIKDISEGGLRILIDRHIYIGTILKLRFTLEEQKEPVPIEVIGKVVWITKCDSGYLVGIQFMV